MQEKFAVFTMDVETFADTECIANSSEDVQVDLMDGFDEYISLLDKYGIKGTLFTVGSLAPKIASKLKKCIKNGHRLALHSYEHIAPMDVSTDTFKREISKAKEHLSNLFGTEVMGFRAPFFSMDNSRLSILKELGFRYDSSHLDFPKARHTVELDLNDFAPLSKDIFQNGDFFEFGMPKQKILGQEFPISGGGYVRLNPWRVIKSVIKQYVKNNNYYVFYLHPFELTRQKIPFVKDLKPHDRYYIKHGISEYKKHIEQIILMLKKEGYKFITFEELTESLSKEGVKAK